MAGATSRLAALGNEPITSSPRTVSRSAASSASATSSSASTRSALVTSPRAAGVSRTLRPSRSRSCVSVSRSSCMSDWEIADGV